MTRRRSGSSTWPSIKSRAAGTRKNWRPCSAELGDDAPLTGFTQAEIDSLTNDIDGLIDGETVDEELRAIEELFNVSLTFDKADQEELKAYVKDYGKEALIEVIIQKAKGEI